MGRNPAWEYSVFGLWPVGIVFLRSADEFRRSRCISNSGVCTADLLALWRAAALPMNSGGVGSYRIPEYAQPTYLLSGGRLPCRALPTNSGGSRESRIQEYAQPTYLLSGGRPVLSYGFFAVAGGAAPCMGKFMLSAGYVFAYHCCNPVVIPGSIIPRRESPPIRDDG